MLLEKRSVVVTGAGSGIGRAIALAAADRGAHLVLIGRRLAALQETAELLPADTRFHLVAADIASAPGRADIVNACRRHGIDILINNAGVVASGLLSGLKDEDLVHIVMTNVAAPIALTRDLVPLLKLSDRPRIVNIGSVFGDIGHPYFAAYCASKFALRGFSDAMRRELAADSIGVTYAAPRATRTPAADGFHDLVVPFAMKLDDPAVVAARIMKGIEAEASIIYPGGPERLFIWLQHLFPAVIDRVLGEKSRRVQSLLETRRAA